MTEPTAEVNAGLSILRIYLRRRRTVRGKGFWGRLFGRSLSFDLADRALRAGITYATIVLGHAGFVPGSKSIVADTVEAAPTTLPTCLELVATARVLDSFVAANTADLADAIMVRLDGIRVAVMGVP